jgi:hypothetical protein
MGRRRSLPERHQGFGREVTLFILCTYKPRAVDKNCSLLIFDSRDGHRRTARFQLNNVPSLEILSQFNYSLATRERCDPKSGLLSISKTERRKVEPSPLLPSLGIDPRAIRPDRGGALPFYAKTFDSHVVSAAFHLNYLPNRKIVRHLIS